MRECLWCQRTCKVNLLGNHSACSQFGYRESNPATCSKLENYSPLHRDTLPEMYQMLIMGLISLTKYGHKSVSKVLHFMSMTLSIEDDCIEISLFAASFRRQQVLYSPPLHKPAAMNPENYWNPCVRYKCLLLHIYSKYYSGVIMVMYMKANTPPFFFFLLQPK